VLWKVSFAFVGITVLAVTLVGVFIWQSTQNDFNRLRQEQEDARFVRVATQFYTLNKAWRGLDAYIRAEIERERAASAPSGAPPPPLGPPMMLLMNSDLMALSNAGVYRAGQPVDRRLWEIGRPLVIEGAEEIRILNLGTVDLDERDRNFLQRTLTSILYAGIGASLVALIAGLALAWRLTRPLRGLTHALQQFDPAGKPLRLPNGSHDEIGQLIHAFNTLSQELYDANQQRRQMTADIAHELRSPLTVITGYLEGLKDGTLPPTPQRFEIIYNEAVQLRRLVEDLRTLSLADSGKLQLSPMDLNIEDFFADLQQKFVVQAEQRQIALITDVPPTLPALHADPGRLAQVFTNLIGNAMRYTPAQGRITLTAVAKEKGVILSVSDTGSGIAADQLPHIFNRFYRADDSRYADQQQTGLGLAIVKSIIEAHGGGVSVESTVGQGTIFTVQLPLA
jgi:signal transduction histidine kinase